MGSLRQTRCSRGQVCEWSIAQSNERLVDYAEEFMTPSSTLSESCIQATPTNVTQSATLRESSVELLARRDFMIQRVKMGLQSQGNEVLFDAEAVNHLVCVTPSRIEDYRFEFGTIR